MQVCEAGRDGAKIVLDQLRVDVQADVRVIKSRSEAIDILNFTVERLRSMGLCPVVTLADQTALVRLDVDLSNIVFPPLVLPFGAAQTDKQDAGPPAAAVQSAAGVRPVLGRIGDASGVDAAAAGVASKKARLDNVWSEEGDAALVALWAKDVSQTAIAAQLGRSVRAIESRVRKLRAAGVDLPLRAPGLTIGQRRTWTVERDEQLLCGYRTNRPMADIAVDLGVSEATCQSRIHRLRAGGKVVIRSRQRVVDPSVWTKERDALLIDLYTKDTDFGAIADAVGCSPKAVSVRLTRLRAVGLVGKRPRLASMGAAQQKSDSLPVPAPVMLAGVAPLAARRVAGFLAHLDAIGCAGGWTPARDLELCNMIWAGRGDFAEVLAVPREVAVQRFRAITRPFRDDRDALPVDVSGRVLPVLRDRAALAAPVAGVAA